MMMNQTSRLIAKVVQMDLGSAVAEMGKKVGKQVADKVTTSGNGLVGRTLIGAARELPGPIKQVAAMSARAGAAGAVVDAAMGGYKAIGAVSRGEADWKKASIHVASEGVCGFLTSGAGTAATVAAFMATGSVGPIVIAAGMGSSMATRWAYRRVVGETLPSPSETASSTTSTDATDKTGEESFEDIGGTNL